MIVSTDNVDLGYWKPVSPRFYTRFRWMDGFGFRNENNVSGLEKHGWWDKLENALLHFEAMFEARRRVGHVS